MFRTKRRRRVAKRKDVVEVAVAEGTTRVRRVVMLCGVLGGIEGVEMWYEQRTWL